MARFVNPYTPRTEIGSSMGNIMQAMFANKANAGSGRAVLYPSEIALHEAQAADHRAKALQTEQTIKGRNDLAGSMASVLRRANESRVSPLEIGYDSQPDSASGLHPDQAMLDALFPQESAPTAQMQGPVIRGVGPSTDTPPRWSDAVTFDGAPTFDSASPPVPQLDLPSGQPGLNLRQTPRTPFPDVRIGHGAPGPLSANDELLMNAGLLQALGLASISSNPNEYAQALGHLQTQANERRFLSGDLKPSDLAVTLGKDVVGEGGGSLYNKFDMSAPAIGLPSAAHANPQWKETVVDGKRQWINLNSPNPTPSGVSAPEPTALINQFAAPVPAVDASGNPVFIQPSHAGGAPKPVAGYFPPPTAAQLKRDADAKAGAVNYQAVDDMITEMQQIVTDHPVATASLLAPSARMWESVKATGSAVAGKELPVENTPAIRIQSMKEGLLVQLGALKGRASNQDVARIDRALGLMSSGTPANAIAGLELARELNAKYNRQTPQGAPSGVQQGGGWTSEKERRLQELRNRAK